MKAIIIAVLLSLTDLTVQAQEKAQNTKGINQHPATLVTFDYLRNAMGQDWRKASALMEPASLKILKARYIIRIKAAATLDDEIALVRRLDCSNLSEVEKLAPSLRC